jgi:hypothetical protein
LRDLADRSEKGILSLVEGLIAQIPDVEEVPVKIIPGCRTTLTHCPPRLDELILVLVSSATPGRDSVESLQAQEDPAPRWV